MLAYTLKRLHHHPPRGSLKERIVSHLIAERKEAKMMTARGSCMYISDARQVQQDSEESGELRTAHSFALSRSLSFISKLSVTKVFATYLRSFGATEISLDTSSATDFGG